MTAPPRLHFLILVRQRGGDGVMHVVRLVRETVQDGEGELIDCVDPGLVVPILVPVLIPFTAAAGKTQSPAQIHQYVPRLIEEDVAVFQDRGVQGWWRDGCAGFGGFVFGEESHHGAQVGRALAREWICDFGEWSISGFEAEADVFGAAGDGGPVVEFVGRCGGGGRGGGIVVVVSCFGTFGGGRAGFGQHVGENLVMRWIEVGAGMCERRYGGKMCGRSVECGGNKHMGV